MEKEMCLHGFIPRPKKKGCEKCQKEYTLEQYPYENKEEPRPKYTHQELEKILDNQKQSLLAEIEGKKVRVGGLFPLSEKSRIKNKILEEVIKLIKEK